MQDAVPLEWIRKMEREKAARAAAERVKRRRWIAVAKLVPGLIAAGALITLIGIATPPLQKTTPALPAPVQALAKALPESQLPNAAGLTVVDGTFAPNTWRVAWETGDAAFCFAFVHQSEQPQTLCDAPHSVDKAKMGIGGELNDDGLIPPELITCGYTTGSAAGIGYAEIDNGLVVGDVTGMGSGLTAFCLQLPDDTAAGQSFTVTTNEWVHNGNQYHLEGVTATYP